MKVRVQEDNLGPVHEIDNMRSVVIYDDYKRPLLIVQKVEQGLPLNGRQATDMIAFTPAVIVQGIAGNGGYPGTQQYVINGGQSFGDAFWLDGSVFNNPWDNANMPFPFPDALQEFKVETSSLTAQNGVHAGGTITGVTKSGTNAFHGDAFEFLRNGDLNGTNWSTHTNEASSATNLAGDRRSGKEGQDILLLRLSGHDHPPDAFTNVSVPTPAMVAGDFSAARPILRGYRRRSRNCSPIISEFRPQFRSGGEKVGESAAARHQPLRR